MTWSGIPFVAPGTSGTRIIRIVNLRANATTVPALASITASVSSDLPVTNPAPIVAISVQGLTFSSALSSPSTVSLTFTENFAQAFLERVENTSTNPFALSRQDLPGVVYGTESQFMPCFNYGNCATTPPSSTIGLADSGTMLLAKLAGLGAKAASLSVPNQINDSLIGPVYTEAYLIVNGKPVLNSGNTSLPVTGGSVDVLYEVTSEIRPQSTR